jgi:predicted nucleic acid-binding Zn ribbon protein
LAVLARSPTRLPRIRGVPLGWLRLSSYAGAGEGRSLMPGVSFENAVEDRRKRAGRPAFVLAQLFLRVGLSGLRATGRVALCAVCNQAIAATGNGRPAKVCSDACRRKHRAQQQRARRSRPRLRVVTATPAVGDVEPNIDPAFHDRRIEKACVGVVLRAVSEGDVRAAMWVLERRFARCWGRREPRSSVPRSPPRRRRACGRRWRTGPTPTAG